MEYKKLDDNTLQITDTTPRVEVSTFIYNDLVATRDGLLLQKQNSIADFDRQIADAQTRIDQADQLGIVAIQTTS